MKKIAAVFILSALILSGCTGTRFSATWKDPNYTGKSYEKLLVWALSDNVAARATVEDETTYFLKLKGINAVSGADILPADRSAIPKDQEVVKKKLVDAGYEAVLTVGLIDVKEETHYVQGNYTPAAFGYYGSFYGYYPYMYGSVYQQGYYASSTNVYLETNLWDVNTGKLVWSGQSKSSDVSSVDKLANSYARAVVSELISKGLLLPSKK
ncbi:MAG: hypothetical protein KDC79_04395 [Cyclobacteriaceae bacterium]|nr:hypothetical protein [Cyclobacteriaceae bacterium]